MSEPSPLEGRISGSQVARILRLIDQTPGKRNTPRAGDVQGQFISFWFDGGACGEETGSNWFILDDGTKVLVETCVPRLAVLVSFPDGRRVSIRQHAPDTGSAD